MSKQEELTRQLIEASKAYYNGQTPLMSDIEFDRNLEELKQMEAESGIVCPGSPTVNVGTATKVDGLETVKHEIPALSLDKIKYANVKDLEKWLEEKEGVVSWKMDGLTVVLTYDDGKLTSAVTRGDGIEGKDVTHNAIFFEGIPKTIEYKQHLVVRGEAVMEYKEFERVNAEAGGIYENPRNLAAATVQMLDASESRKRKISFYAFELVTPEPEAKILVVEFQGAEKPFISSFNISLFKERMNLLGALGFKTVPIGFGVTAENVVDVVGRWEEDLHEGLPFPTDGLVLTYDDLQYGWALGSTGHHPRWAVALKWTDETVKTILRSVEWSVGKTGIVTPVAVFDPIRLGAGSTVTRASLHNISCLRTVPLRNNAYMDEVETMCLNDSVDVYLANMIIPQIASYGHDGDYSLEHPRTGISIPKTCPACGEPLRQEESDGVWTLHCDNNNCSARAIGRLMNTFGKDGLFIKGLGESQVEDLLECKLVTTDPLSFYQMEAKWKKEEYKQDDLNKLYNLLETPGWGSKKWENILKSINDSRKATLQKFLYSLNIPLLGNDLSKKLSKYWHDDVEEFKSFVKEFALVPVPEEWTIDDAAYYEGAYKAWHSKLSGIEGVGEEKVTNILNWIEELISCEKRYEDFIALIDELEFPKAQEESADASLVGLTFVITGSVHEYKNRDEFTASVEARGGKVAGSVSKNTDYLVNNDLESTSGKNAKAKDLGIPIISEDEFISRFGK